MRMTNMMIAVIVVISIIIITKHTNNTIKTFSQKLLKTKSQHISIAMDIHCGAALIRVVSF